MYGSEENRTTIVNFFDKTDKQELIFSATMAGALSVSFTWPTIPKAKTVYFVKRSYEALPKDSTVKQFLVYGDLSYAPIDQLSSFVDEVTSRFLIPIEHLNSNKCTLVLFK